MRRRQVAIALAAAGVSAACREALVHPSFGNSKFMRLSVAASPPPSAPLSSRSPSVTGRNGYEWSQVAFGGGGYVTGIYVHPRVPDLVYIKTDVGGPYRWHAGDRRWLPLMDWLPRSLGNHFGCEGLALDPNDPERIYLAAGKFLFHDNGTIYTSGDRGATWTKLDLDLTMGGNETKRWIGERLAVDPFDSQVLLFGSRLDGLWRSRDAGASWQAIAFPGVLQPDIGITDVTFHPTVAGRVYATAYGYGIYRSDDGGLTWELWSGSPPQAHRIAIAPTPDSTIYVTHAAGVRRYRDRAWAEIAPPRAATSAFNAIALDPFDPQRVLVAYDQLRDRGQSRRVFVSENGGDRWTARTAQRQPQIPWRQFLAFGDAISAIAFDPHVPERVWLTDWFGVWQTDDIRQQPTVWRTEAFGHEELVTFDLISPPRGAALLSGVADLDGFRHESSPAIYPTQTLGGADGPLFQDTYSFAFCEANPDRWARVGGNRYNSTYGGATSADGGQTWQRFRSFPPDVMPLRIAMSATNADVLLVTVSEGTALRSTDGGRSWTHVRGLPPGDRGPWYWAQSLVADKVLEHVFYYYAAGRLYRSEDWGATFAIANAELPDASWHAIATVPAVAGEVWLSLDKAGLLYSRDRARTFTLVASVARSYLFALAPARDSSAPPELYVHGEVERGGQTESGIFQSSDLGQTWQPIHAPALPIGNEPNAMTASRQDPGTIYIGTGGRGVYCGQRA